MIVVQIKPYTFLFDFGWSLQEWGESSNVDLQARSFVL